MTMLSTQTLIGNPVKNLANEDLGKIEDFMLDVDSGEIVYAVLSFGGFLGLGDKLFAVPNQALRLDTENKCYLLNVDKDRLQDAPGFDKDDWPDWSDREFRNMADQFYG